MKGNMHNGGDFTTLYGREGGGAAQGSACVGGVDIARPARSERPRWGEGGGSVARTTEPLLAGASMLRHRADSCGDIRHCSGHPVTSYRWEIDDASDKDNYNLFYCGGYKGVLTWSLYVLAYTAMFTCTLYEKTAQIKGTSSEQAPPRNQ
jgi:hypothetical protein